jgi:hypothetical protein
MNPVRQHRGLSFDRISSDSIAQKIVWMDPSACARRCRIICRELDAARLMVLAQELLIARQMATTLRQIGGPPGSNRGGDLYECFHD